MGRVAQRKHRCKSEAAYWEGIEVSNRRQQLASYTYVNLWTQI